MRVVTVARKPCDGSTTGNVIAHGTGALNVDGTRVAGPAWSRSTDTIEDIRGGRYGTASKDRIKTGPREMPAGGRWPANVVLQHRPGCEVVGERMVTTGTAVRRNVGHSTKGLISYARGTRDAEMREDVSYGDPDGREAVTDWRCKRGCPVPGLDRQSGLTVSGRHGGAPGGFGAEQLYGDGSPTMDLPGAHADTGTASRFFRQVKP